MPDLHEWARVVHGLLRPGGTLYLVEIHPILGAFEEVDGQLRPRSELFKQGPTGIEISATYGDGIDGAPEVEMLTEYSWPWNVSKVVTALLKAGLRIEAMREVPVDCRQRFSVMVPDAAEEGCWRIPGDPLPLSVSCTAVKPA